jgi:hypothetical protein
MAPRISALTLTAVTLVAGAPFAAADDASLGKDLKALVPGKVDHGDRGA